MLQETNQEAPKQMWTILSIESQQQLLRKKQFELQSSVKSIAEKLWIWESVYEYLPLCRDDLCNVEQVQMPKLHDIEASLINSIYNTEKTITAIEILNSSI